jgi:peptide-methionine (S)-S-oxide reductase
MTMKLFRIAVAALITVAASSACQSKAPAPPPPASGKASATFAGGCFWCTESDFDKMPGVLSTVSGFAGGRVANPTYKQVSAGGTGAYEAVRVTYDPRRISYAQLVQRFLPTIDVLDGGGQFCDRGESYRPAIFVANPAERRIAEAALAAASKKLGQKTAVAVLPASRFAPAENYHQDYYKKNAVKYKFYRWNCGRDQRLKELWQR